MTPVSVLLPAYNGAHLLPETLECILTQVYPAAEVIVVDDGSQDDTREVLARFGNHVRYHFTENGGICRARNLAASLASCSYFAFCDQDDLWRSDKLSQQMALHDQNVNLQFSFTNFSYVVEGVSLQQTKLDEAPPHFFSCDLPPGTSPFTYEHSLYESLLRFQPIWPSTIMIRSKFFHDIGGFREELGKNPSEDFEFSLRCVSEGPIGVVREPVVGVRRHATNYSGDNEKNTCGQIEVLQYVLKHHHISQTIRLAVIDQIELRRVEAAYGAFHRGDFDLVVSLLSPVPKRYLDSKSLLKLWVARQPRNVATALWRVLVRK